MTSSINTDSGELYVKALEKLLHAIVGEAQETVEYWYDTVDDALAEIVSIISEVGPLSGRPRIDLLIRFRTAIENFPQPAGRFSREHLQTPALKKLSRTPELMIKRVVRVVDPEEFRLVPGDDGRTRYRKLACRIDHSLHSTLRVVTSLFSRSRKPMLRSFDGKSFVRFNFSLPYERMLLEEWNRFNRAATDVIVSINRHLDEHALDTTTDESSSDDRIALSLKNLSAVRSSATERLMPNLEMLISAIRARLRIAGTALLPGKTYAACRTRKVHRQFGRQFIREREAWQRHWQGVLMDLQKDSDLLRLEDEVHIAQTETWETIVRELRQKTYELFDDIQQIILEMKEAADTADLSSRNSTRSFLVGQRRRFTGSAADEHLTPVSEIVMSFDLNGLLVSFRERIRGAAELLEERYVIFTLSDREHLIPESQFEMVPLRELFLRQFTTEMSGHFELIGDNGRNNLIALSNQPVVLGEIVESMFDTAYMELRKSGKPEDEKGCITHAMKEYRDGIGRILSTLESMRKQLDATVDELHREITESGKSMQSYIGELRRSDRLLALKLKLARSRATEQLTGYRKYFFEALSRTGHRLFVRLKVAANAVWLPLKRFYHAFSRVTRLDVRTPRKDQSTVEVYLKMARNSLDSLPAVYRRAFRFDPLDSEKLLTDRAGQLDAIGAAFSDWRNGLTGLLALTGERGSGRSTIARIARNRYFIEIPVLRVVPAGTIFTEADLATFFSRSLGVTETDSMEMLEQEIAELDEYRVLIVEDVHHIFLRTIPGLMVFRRFLLFATRTQSTVFWFLTCGEYVWRYLDKVLGLNRYFTRVVSLDGLPSDDVEELIMRRHRLCGIPIRFTADHAMLRSKKYRQCSNERERQALLQNQFFRKLTEASTGNVSVAMLFWCIAIKNENHKMFEIDGLPELDLRIETAISSEEVFVITAIVQHERMSPLDLATVLSLTPETALLHLTGLKNKGFLIEKEGFYELHFFLYRSFIGFLHEKRLLH